MKKDKILIGIVLRPQGIYGELKLKDLSDGFDQIADIKSVYINDKAHKVLNIRYSPQAMLLTVDGIYDRNAAEEYRGAQVYVDRTELNLGDDQYLIAEVLGCDLYLSSGKKLGEIFDITSARVDIYSVKVDSKTAKFPMLKDLNPIFDVENNSVTVDAKRFTEVVMYED